MNFMKLMLQFQYYLLSTKSGTQNWDPARPRWDQR